MNSINFKSSFKKSQVDAKAFPIDKALELLLPGFRHTIPTTDEEDRLGADAKAKINRDIAKLDYKVRSCDPRTWGEDDLVIEIYSVVEKQIRGYANRSTDYLVWIYSDTRRCVIIPFEKFKKIYAEHWTEWDFWLSEPDQTTRMGNTIYHSRFAKVPFEIFSPIAKEVTLN